MQDMYGREVKTEKKEKPSKKAKPIVGKFISDYSEDELKKAQKKRTVFMLLSHISFAVTLFFSQKCLLAISKLMPLTTAYVLIIIAVIIDCVFISYQNFRKYKLRKEVSENDAPHNGFDRRTYYGYDIFLFMHVILALVQLGLIIYAFDVMGLIVLLLYIASAIFAFFTHRVSFITNARHMEYFPPIVPQLPTETVESETQENAAQNEEPIDLNKK